MSIAVSNKESQAARLVSSQPVEHDLRWCPVSLGEVLDRDLRLEASVFGIEGKDARKVLNNCRWPMATLTGKKGMADAYHRPRFKRIWIGSSGIPIFQPSQVTEICPKPNSYISHLTNTDIDALRVRKSQIMITCSGTIGICSIVGKTLEDSVFSHDLLRMTCKRATDTGYVYAYLKSAVGSILIRTNEYGAVVSHIEPEHLDSVPVPAAPEPVKRRIHDMIVRSYDLRDESNSLLDEAQHLLIDSLGLPSLEAMTPQYYSHIHDIRNYAVKLSQLDGRIDGSYHVPIAHVILEWLQRQASEVATIGDARVSKRIILPGRFARVYVSEGHGVVFFGGKQLLQLDPTNKKYLSLRHHSERIAHELRLKENMIMITCSGTIGKTALVPRHWEGWTANQHIIRVEPARTEIAGYLYVYLSTPYAQELIKRFIYGSVVDEIDDHQVSEIPVPFLGDSATETEINRLALEANEKRTEAYQLEQQAIQIMNEEVIYANAVADD